MKFQAENGKVKISGRTIYREGIRYLGYSGTSISFSFVGKKASAVLITDIENWEEITKAWVAVFVNGEEVPHKRFALTKTEAEYVLYESDVEKEVTITLMKYSEVEYAKCGIKEIIVDTDRLLPPPLCKERKILVIGDSITCGYGIEGKLEDMEFRTSEENPMKAYALQMVHALDAEAHIVAWNGKGVITSYIDEESNEKETSCLVPMLYEYVDAGCENDYFKQPKEKWEKWNHEDYQAQLVTVYLGTNDASYTREIPERNEEFSKAYFCFLERIHETQPKANILCMLGTMDQRLCKTIDKTVEMFKEKYPDVVIEYLDLPHQKDEDGLGTFWHPTVITQRKTAELVTKKVQQMMNW